MADGDDKKSPDGTTGATVATVSADDIKAQVLKINNAQDARISQQDTRISEIAENGLRLAEQVRSLKVGAIEHEDLEDFGKTIRGEISTAIQALGAELKAQLEQYIEGRSHSTQPTTIAAKLCPTCGSPGHEIC